LLTIRALDSPASKSRNLDSSAWVQRPLGRLATRIADQPGGPAHQPDWPVPGQLKPTHGQQQGQAADVQARRRRVKAGVEGDPARVQRLTQLFDICRVGQQASPGEFVDNVVHACMVPSMGR
jgi:hypothetical protein